jgi:hypothetical protein
MMHVLMHVMHEAQSGRNGFTHHSARLGFGQPGADWPRGLAQIRMDVQNGITAFSTRANDTILAESSVQVLPRVLP